MKKVRLKSREAIKKLEREGKIEHIFTSDSGEVTHYGVPGINPQPIMTIWWEDYGTEYAIVDHPSPMSKDAYEARKIFFEEEE